MRSLFLMLGAYALYRIVQENSQPADRRLAQSPQVPKGRAAARPRLKAAG